MGQWVTGINPLPMHDPLSALVSQACEHRNAESFICTDDLRMFGLSL